MRTPGRSLPGTGMMKRHGAGGDDQLVVAFGHAVVGGDGLRVAVDRDDLVALVERDAVLDVPAVAVDDDLLVVSFRRKAPARA